MLTVTIDKTITKGEELVVIPKKEYEILLRSAKEKNGLDKDLIKALQEVKQGQAIGPFHSVKELRKSLEK